jgi:nitrogen fixation/metabolism regulation signal transduction histidine kinase
VELRSELLLTLGSIVVLNLLLAFGAIGLFVRMGPAISRILEDNVVSVVAAEELLAELAAAGTEPLAADARERAALSLAKARNNVTEEAERPVLGSIEQRLEPALDGVPEARRLLVDDLRQLIVINRDSMHGVDEEARRLGRSGAWSAVLIGFLSFMSSLLVAVRLQRRFVRPLVDLHDVLESSRQGNAHRRCRLSDAPREVVQVAQAVNQLLDERSPPRSRAASAS